jgi:hypothetical protein
VSLPSNRFCKRFNLGNLKDHISSTDFDGYSSSCFNSGREVKSNDFRKEVEWNLDLTHCKSIGSF